MGFIHGNGSWTPDIVSISHWDWSSQSSLWKSIHGVSTPQNKTAKKLSRNDDEKHGKSCENPSLKLYKMSMDRKRMWHRTEKESEKHSGCVRICLDVCMRACVRESNQNDNHNNNNEWMWKCESCEQWTTKSGKKILLDGFYERVCFFLSRAKSGSAHANKFQLCSLFNKRWIH